MRFAIISDIHGNLPALDAVLEDAKRNQVESYISPLNSNAKTKIVSTIYQTADTVICDAVATDYGADKTGVKDSTSSVPRFDTIKDAQS